MKTKENVLNREVYTVADLLNVLSDLGNEDMNLPLELEVCGGPITVRRITGEPEPDEAPDYTEWVSLET